MTRMLETSFGLLDHLYSFGVLSDDQFDEIRALTHAPIKQTIHKLFDVLRSKPDDVVIFDKFLEALKVTDQLHVIHYIESNGGELNCIYSDNNCDWIRIRAACAGSSNRPSSPPNPTPSS